MIVASRGLRSHQRQHANRASLPRPTGLFRRVERRNRPPCEITRTRVESLTFGTPVARSLAGGVHGHATGGWTRTHHIGTDKRYGRRDTQGRFKESDDVGRSLAADRQRKAKTKTAKGQGDRGDC
jgi:hypothetical protein